MYKRICTPIVSYKNDTKNNCVKILDLSVINSDNITINLYHAENEKDCMMFDYKGEAIGFILKICSMRGYTPKILRKDFGVTWYDIQWVDIDNYKIKMYGKREEKN